ncbi:unnamed protein product, partial [Didymodactylos carnosus]
LYQQFCGQTWNDSSSANVFINVIGKNKSKFHLTSVQCTSAQNCNTSDWDLTRLTTLLLNSNPPKTVSKTDAQRGDNEDKLLVQLQHI